MRHLLANAFIYGLTGALVAGSLLWAWARSAQLIIARETEVEPSFTADVTGPAAAAYLDFGRRVYVANCQNCHTADGSGRGMYPPVQNMGAHLSGATRLRSGAPEAESRGRDYLIDIYLHGVYTGTYNAPMPPMPELSDAEIAAVNNYILTAFAAEGRVPDAGQLYRPEEIAARRGGPNLSEWEVADTRPDIPTARELGRGVRVGIRDADSAVPAGEDE